MRIHKTKVATSRNQHVKSEERSKSGFKLFFVCFIFGFRIRNFSIYDGVCANRIKLFSDSEISQFQGGFRDKIGTLEQFYVLREIVLSSKRRDCPLFLGFFDVKGAFDRVPTSELLLKLWQYGITGKFWRLMKHIYSSMYAFFNQNNENFLFKLSAGLRQGGKSSPILWNLFFNDLEKYLNGTEKFELKENFELSVAFLLLLFADDLVLIGKSVSDLQKKINILLTYAKKWGLEFSVSKCKILPVHNPFLESVELKMGNTVLENVTEYKYLGIKIDSSGIDFAKFIQDKCNEAETRSSMLSSFLAKFEFSTVEDAVRLHNALVRPLLETGSQVIFYDRDNLDKIEKTNLKCLRNYLKIFSSTLRETQRFLAGVEPMKMRIHRLKLKFFSKNCESV